MIDFPAQDDIFKGVNARIMCRAIFNEQKMAYDHFYDWLGDDLAGMSGGLVSILKPGAAIGDVLVLGDLALRLVDYSPEPLGDFWYVRRLQ